MSEHTVAERVLVPGVSYMEMACIAYQEASCAFRHLNFVRACVIPEKLTSNRSLAVRCVSLEAGGFIIESWEVQETVPHGARFMTNITGHRVGSAVGVPACQTSAGRRECPDSWLMKSLCFSAGCLGCRARTTRFL